MISCMQLVGYLDLCEMSKSNEVNFKVAKKVLKYVKQTTNSNIVYNTKNELKLTIYVDIDWSGSIDNVKKIFRDIFTLGLCIWYVTIWCRKILKYLPKEQNEATIKCHITWQAEKKSKLKLIHSCVEKQMADVLTNILSVEKVLCLRS